jgi:hypothetical protein
MKQMHVYSHVAKLAQLTPERFYQHTVPEHLQEQGDRVVREIIKRDTRQMALDIAKWEDQQK